MTILAVPSMALLQKLCEYVYDRSAKGFNESTANGTAVIATKKAEEITEFFTRWPTANLAAACGSASRLLVFDGDGEEGIAALCRHRSRTSRSCR